MVLQQAMRRRCPLSMHYREPIASSKRDSISLYQQPAGPLERYSAADARLVRVTVMHPTSVFGCLNGMFWLLSKTGPGEDVRREGISTSRTGAQGSYLGS
jgi:hypothetical protein